MGDPKDKQLLARLEAARKSVERSDAIRRGHLYPEVGLEKKKGTISKSGMRYVRKDLQDATEELRSSRSFRLTVRIANLLQAVTIPYVTFLIGTTVLRVRLTPPWNVLTSPYVVLPMVALAAAFIALKQYIGRITKKYVDKRASDDARDRTLKKIAQQAISDLAKQLSVSHIDPKEFKFKIFHRDYDGIEVVSRPGLLKEYYVATVQVERDVNLREGN